MKLWQAVSPSLVGGHCAVTSSQEASRRLGFMLAMVALMTSQGHLLSSLLSVFHSLLQLVCPCAENEDLAMILSFF